VTARHNKATEVPPEEMVWAAFIRLKPL